MIIIPMLLFHYLQSFLLFACLFSLLIWHHEHGLGLVMGITDSGAAVFLFLVLVIHKHGLSLFFVDRHSINNIFLSHCPWQIYQVMRFPLFFLSFSRLLCVCVYMIVIGWLSSFFCPFLLSGW